MPFTVPTTKRSNALLEHLMQPPLSVRPPEPKRTEKTEPTTTEFPWQKKAEQRSNALSALTLVETLAKTPEQKAKAKELNTIFWAVDGYNSLPGTNWERDIVTLAHELGISHRQAFQRYQHHLL